MQVPIVKPQITLIISNNSFASSHKVQVRIPCIKLTIVKSSLFHSFDVWLNQNSLCKLWHAWCHAPYASGSLDQLKNFAALPTLRQQKQRTTPIVHFFCHTVPKMNVSNSFILRQIAKNENNEMAFLLLVKCTIWIFPVVNAFIVGF